MTRRIVLGVAVIAGVVLFTPPESLRSQPKPAVPAPRLEPVAETKLLMEGLAKANFDGLARLLKQKPADMEAWSFARGQGLLIAETGNLLMMRPPATKDAQEKWMQRSVDLRLAGTQLAKAAASKDYLATRAAFANLANTCNRCHVAFQVPTRLDPAEVPPD